MPGGDAIFLGNKNPSMYTFFYQICTKKACYYLCTWLQTAKFNGKKKQDMFKFILDDIAQRCFAYQTRLHTSTKALKEANIVVVQKQFFFNILQSAKLPGRKETTRRCFCQKGIAICLTHFPLFVVRQYYGRGSTWGRRLTFCLFTQPLSIASEMLRLPAPLIAWSHVMLRHIMEKA